MDDLLREFLTETNESLDTVNVELVRFEQDPNNAKDMDAVWAKVREARDLTKKYWGSGAELMDLMVQANIASVFVGIESPNEASLRETKKYQNVRAGGTMVEKVRRIQDAGMEVWCGLILGFDHDDPTNPLSAGCLVLVTVWRKTIGGAGKAGGTVVFRADLAYAQRPRHERA